MIYDRETGPKYAQRSKTSNWSDKHRSSFEKQAQEAEKNKTVKTGLFHTGGDYHTKMVSEATTDKKFHGKEFAQSGKKDTQLNKTFHNTKESDPMASKNFKTTESHQFEKKAHDDGRMFAGNDKTFATKSDVRAANAATKTQKPKIIENGKPGYTEDEVRAMLNKGPF
jgi:hypothetical protein